MSTQRKTELGRDLQRRADACAKLADKALNPTMEHDYLPKVDIARLEGKAQAYAHAAELADASDL